MSVKNRFSFSIIQVVSGHSIAKAESQYPVLDIVVLPLMVVVILCNITNEIILQKTNQNNKLTQ